MSNPYMVVEQFEEVMAEFCGSEYAVAVESCTAAIFLCCLLHGIQDEEVFIPKHTYPGVANSIIHAGGKVRFTDEDWSGSYMLHPFPIFDRALQLKAGMHVTGYDCLSFHSKKQLPIGRGGMILTDDARSVEKLKQMRFDGRHECALKQDSINIVGWNMYMTPEQAARGLILFDHVKNRELQDLRVQDQGYPDLSKMPAYQQRGI